MTAFLKKNRTPFEFAMSAKPGVLVQGIGYKLPKRSDTHDASSGERKTRVSDETMMAMRVLRTDKTNRSRRAEARRQMYHDVAVMCSKEELDAFELLGKPICYEHDESKQIGHILNYNILPNGELSLTASITDPDWKSRISLGDFDAKYFSINYDFSLDKNGCVSNKRFKEISLVKKPYYSGCDMGVYAGSSQSVVASGDNLSFDSDDNDCSIVVCESIFPSSRESSSSDDEAIVVSVRCSHESGTLLLLFFLKTLRRCGRRKW